ncbi:MAG: gliding motility-associated C-terminal domain-containing protein [Bacteroidia bacterium]|nr:gliding motility-associated C-terminal domain-containing protein [Bacteroidia bacterium]
MKVGGALSDGGAYNLAGLEVDTSGNIYFSATMNGSANFVSSNGNVQVRNSMGQNDAFILKMNSNGIIQWVNQIGSSTGNDEGGGITIDRNQNVYVTGMFFGNATFQSIGSSSSVVSSFGNGDAFLAKYSPTGSLMYASRVGGSLLDVGAYLDCDSTGAVYMAGNFGCCNNNFVNFGANNLQNTGNWGGFVAKFDPNGNVLWGNGMGANGGEAMQDIVVDDYNDKVYAIGHYQGNTTFTTRPGGAAVNLTNTGGNYNAVIVAMDLNGRTQWARTTSGTGNEYGYSIDLDPDRNIVVSGDFTSVTNFGGISLTPSGTGSAFFARYTKNNILIEAQKVGNGSYTNGWNIHVGTTGLIYLTGYFQGQTIVGLDSLNSAGSEDAFIARLTRLDTTYIGVKTPNLACFGDTAVIYLPNKRIGNFVWFRNDTPFQLTHGNFILTNVPGTYKAVGVNYCALLDTSASVVITKSPYFVAERVGNISVCVGDSGRFNATAASTYTWSPAAGLSDTSIANPFVKPTTNATYYLRRTLYECIALDTVSVSVTNNCCLTCSSPYQLNNGVVACYPFNGNSNDESGYGNHAQAYNAALAPDRFNVANRAYQFNGFSSYLEVPNSSSIQSPGGNLSFTFWARVSNWNFNAGVQYTPILSKSNATSSAQYRAMIRSNGLYVMADGNSFSPIIGSNTNTNTWYFFTITVSNDSVYYYRNGTLLGFATGSVPYTLNNSTPLRLGRNDVNTQVFFNGRLDEVRIYGRTLSAAEILSLYQLSSINGKPTITAGANKNMCKGDSIRLVTTGTNGTYLWTPNTLLSSDTARSPYSSADSTTDYVVSVDVSGCKNYDTVLVNVVDFQPSLGLDQNICYGDTAQIIVVNGGNTFAWTPNYKITPTNNDTVKVFPLVDTNYVMASNNGLCVRRDTIHISVLIPSLDAGPDPQICKDDTATFAITTNGTVRWSPLTYLSDSIGTSVYSVADTNITYYLTSNYFGCIARDTVSVSVATLPVDAGLNQLICYGDSVQLQASGATTYIWIPNYQLSDSSISNPWVKPLKSTYYFAISYNLLCSRYDSVLVDVKQAQANAGPDKSICDGDSIRLSATAIGPYTWTPSATLGDTGLIPYAKPMVTTNYILNVNNFGCLASDTVTVNVAVFHISAGSDKTICLGDSAQLTATGGTKYNWLPNYNVSDTGIADPWVKPISPTNYYLISNNGICLKVDTVFVDVKTISASAGLDTSICEGLSVGLNASGGASYLWLNPYNLSDPSIPNPIASPLVDTTYYVQISDGSTCTITEKVRVAVDKYPTVDAGIDQKHCLGEFVKLNSSVTDYTNIIWSPATGLDDILLLQPNASVTSLTTYVLSAWNNYCYSSDTVIVNVNPKVVASFQPDPISGIAPLPVTFQNNSQNAYFYTWLFDDIGSGSNDVSPTFTYNSEGVFTIFLTAKDSLGCWDTSSAIVTVKTVETIFAPNAFTPNNDGVNDVFALVYDANKFENVEMKIFNRWGVQVFENKMPGSTWWDGKINGNPEPPGIFTYYVLAKDKKGKSYSLTGTVAIVR